jgi:hypothetical protein
MEVNTKGESLMKRLLLFCLLISLSLTACGETTSNSGTNGDHQAADTKEESNGDVDQQEVQETKEIESDNELKVDKSEEFDEKTGKGFIDGLGYVETIGVGYSEELGIDGSDDPLKPIKMGSMELEIQSLFILEVELDEDAQMLYFNDEEKVKAIVIDMKVENKEETDVEFYPDNAIVTTDTGEQVESEIGLMEGVGGEFFGKVKKEGQTWWLLNNLDEEIKNVKMIISPPYDMDGWEDLDEEKRLDFDVLTYDKALELDIGKEM